MLLPLPTPTEMATWDRETIDSGIPGLALMEAASREALSVLIREFGPVTNTTIYCFAGSGNNGGDAFAMGRQLAELGADVTIFHTKPEAAYTGDTQTNFFWAKSLEVPISHLDTVDVNALPQPDILIDGLLGTGFSGELRTSFLNLVNAMNRMGEKAFVLSLDVPSGLNGLTGQACPTAVIADTTVTFQAAKLGLAMPEASRYTGMLHIRPIGITAKVRENYPVRHHLISHQAMASIPAPRHDMHKGDAGRVLIAGGSPGLTGAPHLAALGALRSGTGLVTIACPAGLEEAVKANMPDIMTLPLGTGTQWTPDMATRLLDVAPRFDALVVGPGMGREPDTINFLKAFIPQCPARTVLDADALFGLAQFPEMLAELPGTAIITPHPAEMGRILNMATADIQADRLGAAARFVEKSQATLILKGAGTLVTDKSATCISPFSEPNLAVGGSGDVLSGLIASLLGQGLGQLQAACLGVYWHGMAGRMLRNEFPLRGNLASEIANMLPMAAKEPISC